MNMATFEDWNKELLDFYFNPANRDLPIRFEVDQELLDEEFSYLGGSTGFLQAVRKGPVHLDNGDYPDLRRKFLGLVEPWEDARWRKKNPDKLSSPTFMPYLILFCYAWSIGDELNLLNYFQRLNKVYPGHGLKSLTDCHLYENNFQVNGIFHNLANWANRPHPDGLGKSHGIFLPKCIGNVGVGWPLGQVILSTKRRQRLGYLFGVIGINDLAGEIDDHELAARLKNYNVDANWALGIKLNQLIQDADLDSVNLIKEKIKEWDGSVEEVRENNGDIKRQMANCRPLLLIRPNRDPKITLTIENELENYPSGEISFSLGRASYDCSIWLSGADRPNFKNQENIDLNFGNFIFEEFNCMGSWRNDLDVLDIRLRYEKRDCITFQVENQQLIEINKLPQNGPVYFVLNSESDGIIRAWDKIRIRHSEIVTNFTESFGQLNNKNNSQIWCITKIQGVPQDLIQHLFNDNQRPDRSYIRLVGGYKLRSRINRFTYFSWGPPQAHVILTDGQIIEAENGTITKCDIKLMPLRSGLIEENIEIYSVIPDFGKTCVYLKVWKNEGGRLEGPLETMPVFFSWKDNVRPLPEGSTFAVGKLGEIASGEGLAGVDLNDNNSVDSCKIDIMEKFLGRVSRPRPTGPKFYYPGILLTWLADRSRGGRVPYGVVRDFLSCHRINCSSKTFSVFPSHELKALRQLGHIEIETDHYGRFTYVHPLPPCIYALPTKSPDDQFRAVLTGCYTPEQIINIKSDVEKKGLSWDSIKQLGGGDYEQIHCFVPNLEMVLYTKDQEDIVEEIAQYNGIKFLASAPSLTISKWAGCLADWENTLSWSQDAKSVGDIYYDIKLFDFSKNKVMDSQSKLKKKWFGSSDNSAGQISFIRGVDPQTNWHHRHQLKRILNGTTSYAFVRQREWGCWLLIKSLNDCQNIAYFPKNGRVVVPIGADLPHLLSRALVLCSGLAPFYIPFSDFVPVEKEFLRKVYSNKVGLLVQYTDVPFDIAKSVFAKVNCGPNRFEE